jgi:leucyl-tRNA synthetase
MEYNFREIEKKWQQRWKETSAYKVSNDFSRPKCYVLDMFPYPSGAGLHVGHPLGYIASDIYSRYKRLKGFNVLHPMGFDAFGLPAEQYAIEHGIHPAVSTATNIENFKKQLDNIGFCYDWDREVNTSEPRYYKWTQWIFLQLFKSWYNRKKNKAESIEGLINIFETEGNINHPIPNDKFQIPNSSSGTFTTDQWKSFDEFTQQSILMEYRIAYCGYGEVNWCEALGTVLANDEVVNGVSERGGHPVVKKKLRQWYLRITEYADRLLQGLETVDFSEAMKDMQSNWIGKSSGAEIEFAISYGESDETREIVNHYTDEEGDEIEVEEVTFTETLLDQTLRVYTTRPDTIFGVDFMVIAPEHELVEQITTTEQKQAVEDYITYVKSRSERERMAEKKISGVFTGSYASNPFNGKRIPIWISEYVLAGYGTGAIMAVPCGDERDHKFAKHFNIPITNIIGDAYNGEEANATKDAKLSNSDFLDGMVMKDAIEVVINKLEELGIGGRKTNYKMRDAAFSRQRYWGEPFPIIWKEGIAYPLDESELPLELPKVDSYSPGPEGEGPLANIDSWTARNLETNTMPGYAGSSWYFLRYMDPHNEETFCDRKIAEYWNQVDIYIGGTEHAVGHLLYSRMWTKCLFDLGLIGHEEPYRKLVNQGMIQGSSRFVYRIQPVFNDSFKKFPKQLFISKSILDSVAGSGKWNGETYLVSKEITDKLYNLLKKQVTDLPFLMDLHPVAPFNIQEIHVDVNLVDGYELDVTAFREWRNGEYSNAEFIVEDGKYICGSEVEKMSKSKFNTVNPDDLVNKYGADTFRMYEMFLGPIDQSKPWDTKGIEGVHRFLKKLWRLFFDELKGKIWNEEKATPEELKVLHKTVRKIEDDTERFSFNTAVAAFMVCANELHDLKCYKKEILEQVVILLTPYAPHIAEELWSALENKGSVLDASYPTFEAKYVVESSKEYPVSINGKLRTTINISLDAEQAEVEKLVLANEVIQKWVEGKEIRKFIFVKGKMVNVVV